MSLDSIQKRLEEALGLSLSTEQAALLNAHLSFVVEQNRKVNLTSIREREPGIVLHIEDSLSALPEVMAAPEGSLVDLGSGGGFPGIPLAIVSQRNCTLVEATGKKAQLLRRFLYENDLVDSVSVETLRIEALARKMKERFAVATARALGSLSAVMELAAPLLQRGGILVAYKGNPTDEEIEKAASLEDELGMVLVGQRSFVLSDGVSRRVIVQAEKRKEAKFALPRRDGQTQKKHRS